ncbi:unnamed protein product [Tilletia caries]|uniref:Uncharacterized protein n=1 Tax=Tilletia caries TaxID=13290 RepID=A0ABN7INQ3_9BASI|nr:unnamed protein product [Tilletia caries]
MSSRHACVVPLQRQEGIPKKSTCVQADLILTGFESLYRGIAEHRLPHTVNQFADRFNARGGPFRQILFLFGQLCPTGKPQSQDNNGKELHCKVALPLATQIFRGVAHHEDARGWRHILLYLLRSGS